MDRIKAVQPLNRPVGERERDALILIPALDIQDKHRLAISARPVVVAADVNHALEFETEGASARNVPPDVTIDNSRLPEAILRFSGSTLDPVVRITGSVKLSLDLVVATPQGPNP